MPVVGVDFGTTNVRIATWNPDETDRIPQPAKIGQGDAPNMPAVLAFQRRNGGISQIVGEDADGLADDDNTVVVRNLKRWALSGDPFVKWSLDASRAQTPAWWDPDTRCVVAFGESFPVWEVIRPILAEAVRRAGLTGEFDWGAGCPVHANADYRSGLTQTLGDLGGRGKTVAVIEEPILYLTLAHRLATLAPGSYLVYDLGGGSFDCALAEATSDGPTTVYASGGAPLLGGANIDALLAARLDYTGAPLLLRIAKERLTPASPAQDIDGNVSLAWTDLEYVLNRSKFLAHTLVAMREAYISAKVIWKYDANAPTLGGSVIPSCRLHDLASAFAKDLDAIILTGGPTRSPFFRAQLAEKFGAPKVRAAADLIPVEIPEPELTGISIGACYAAAENPAPLYVRRLPARVTLRNAGTGDSVEYQPYQHFARNFNPASPFRSAPLAPPANPDAQYELTIADPEGTVRRREHFTLARRPGDNAPRLLIDTLGWIGVDFADSRPPQLVISDPPWQTHRQRELLREIIAKRQEQEIREQERIRRLTTENPFGWQSGHS